MTGSIIRGIRLAMFSILRPSGQTAWQVVEQARHGYVADQHCRRRARRPRTSDPSHEEGGGVQVTPATAIDIRHHLRPIASHSAGTAPFPTRRLQRQHGARTTRVERHQGEKCMAACGRASNSSCRNYTEAVVIQLPTRDQGCRFL